MRYGDIVISVSDLNRSIRFYETVLGQRAEHDYGFRIVLSCGIILQADAEWKYVIGKDEISYGGNDAELYFEEEDFDGFVRRLSDSPETRYVHPPIEHRSGQRSVRIYDPDMHIIEIGEDLRSVCRRFLSRGMDAVQISERTEVPLKYVRSCLARDTLESERLLLRPWRPQDAEELFSLASDPEIGPMAGWEPHPDIYASAVVIEKVLMKPGTFAVILKDTGRIIGSMSIATEETSIPINDSDAEIGFWIGRDHWNKGYATEASRTALDYAFGDLGCRDVWCICLEGNVRCIRVQEKLGFLFRKTEDVYSSIFGTRCMAVSCLSSDRWRLLSGKRHS